MVKLMVELDDMQKDVLKEVSNISSGQAIISLEKYVKVQIKEGLPFMDIMLVESIPRFIGDVKKDVVGVYSNVEGDLDGKVMTIFPIQSALVLVDLAYGRKIYSTKELSDKESGFIKEVGESLFNSYIKALTDFLEIEVNRGESNILKSSGGKIMKKAGMGDGKELALVLETNFSVPDFDFEGDFLLVVSTNSMNMLLNAVQRKFGF
ncbi:MAG: hypothetical protein B6U97_04070 [Candidatus Altiarchaeales archaeon ex4484_96]|nr:MAG: hypothetical protein B6U97_04070 [Candidatus Altiarchaeales archaeon ex4484_96]